MKTSECPDCLDAFTCSHCESGCVCDVPAWSNCPEHGSCDNCGEVGRENDGLCDTCDRAERSRA